MTSVSPHASDQQLERLLQDSEDGRDTLLVMSHVETCESCQSRLNQYVAKDRFHQDVTQLLSGQTISDRAYDREVGFLSHRSKHRESDSALLDAPSHPEMLGRLGRYEIERRLGAGGMGIVFKGMDTELNRPVAIKVLAPYLSRNDAARQRFARESRAAAAVVHEHVVAIHNVESNGENPYLVMQYISGESLQSRVDRLGPMNMEQILRIGIQACSGLAAAHEQGIVHRDVKPANILMEDGVERVLLTDFGLARTVDDASLTHTGVIAGTPHYMSPEQANGDSVDHRSDLFSLGAVLYFIATGAPPFQADRAMGVLHCICSQPHQSLSNVHSKISLELSDLVDKLLEKKPARRFRDAQSVRDELARILVQQQSSRLRLKSEMRRLGRRHRASAWTFAIGSLFASCVFAGMQWYHAWTSDVQNKAAASSHFHETTDSRPTGETESLEDGRNPSPLPAELSLFEQTDFLGQLQELRHQVDNYQRRFESSQTDLQDESQNFRQQLRRMEQSLRSLDPFSTPIP